MIQPSSENEKGKVFISLLCRIPLCIILILLCACEGGSGISSDTSSEIGSIAFNPTLLTPEDDSTVTNGALSYEWDPVAGASEYQIQVSSTPISTFSDDFDRNDFSDKWTSGATCESNTIKLVNGRIRATANCNYIETHESFTGNLVIEVDVEKVGITDHGCWDFYIELSAIDKCGVIRFDRHGIDGINVGDCHCGDRYSISSEGPNKGKAVLNYSDPYLQFSFTNENGEILETDKVHAGSFDTSKIRIWLAAHADSPRYIDNVIVDSIDFTFTGINESVTTTFYTPTTTLSAGTYYWRVRAKDTYGNEGGWSEVWSFTVSSESDIAETEPNNDMEHAGSLASGGSITGQLSPESDEDWFSVSTSGADIINVNFQTDTVYDNDFWHISIVDPSGNELTKVPCCRYNQETELDVEVSEVGTYYIAITKYSIGGFYSHRDDSYTLTVWLY